MIYFIFYIIFLLFNFFNQDFKKIINPRRKLYFALCKHLNCLYNYQKEHNSLKSSTLL